jgi:hypothetical protein
VSPIRARIKFLAFVPVSFTNTPGHGWLRKLCGYLAQSRKKNPTPPFDDKPDHAADPLLVQLIA